MKFKDVSYLSMTIVEGLISQIKANTVDNANSITMSSCPLFLFFVHNILNIGIPFSSWLRTIAAYRGKSHWFVLKIKSNAHALPLEIFFVTILMNSSWITTINGYFVLSRCFGAYGWWKMILSYSCSLITSTWAESQSSTLKESNKTKSTLE